MLTQKTENQLTVSNEKRSYVFTFPVDSPVGEIYDALFQMKSFIAQQIQLVEERDKASKDQSTKNEECNGNPKCCASDMPNQ